MKYSTAEFGSFREKPSDRETFAIYGLGKTPFFHFQVYGTR